MIECDAMTDEIDSEDSGHDHEIEPLEVHTEVNGLLLDFGKMDPRADWVGIGIFPSKSVGFG